MRRRTFLTAAAVGGIVAYQRLRRCPPRPRAGELRVVSWNLRNFPDADHDIGRVEDTVTELAPDILALQEIRDPTALPFGDLEVHLSEHGGARPQRLGVAFHPQRAELAYPSYEDRRIDLDGRVRPAFIAPLHTAIGPLTVIVVHLKARPSGAPARRSQWAALAELAGEIPGPLVVLGDFNATGGRAERTDLAAALRPAGLEPIPNPQGCSAYWEGVRHDGWHEPSLLDLAYIRREAGIGALDPARPAGLCARRACAPTRSTATHPDLDLYRASDHCPVLLRLGHL